MQVDLFREDMTLDGTILKKSMMSFRIFRSILTEVGPFLKILYDFNFIELAHLQ